MGKHIFFLFWNARSIFSAHKKIFLFFISVILTFVTLKRVALLSIFVVFAIIILPEKIRKIVTKSYIVTPITVLYVFISIQFSQGQYDTLILDLTEKSADAVSQGRQFIWESLLNAVNYNFYDFFFLV
ncbi:hypothetical protein [Thiorhodococcus drewsii]|uniref:hypothetical protein n=1 Tax=Thiorhodococcus drewsii TaxID=210408 RepID=UPI0011128A78|nr:hypothetical protein [Thiorhodococcus drewsii]